MPQLSFMDYSWLSNQLKEYLTFPSSFFVEENFWTLYENLPDEY